MKKPTPYDINAAASELSPYGKRHGTFWGFDEVPPDVLLRVLEHAPSLRDDQQNSSPTFGKMLHLRHFYKDITFHGYCVEGREDDRVTLEGFNHSDARGICIVKGWSPDELSDTRAWWD